MQHIPEICEVHLLKILTKLSIVKNNNIPLGQIFSTHHQLKSIFYWWQEKWADQTYFCCPSLSRPFNLSIANCVVNFAFILYLYHISVFSPQLFCEFCSYCFFLSRFSRALSYLQQSDLLDSLESNFLMLYIKFKFAIKLSHMSLQLRHL